jgi:hypothetical protein
MQSRAKAMGQPWALPSALVDVGLSDPAEQTALADREIFRDLAERLRAFTR